MLLVGDLCDGRSDGRTVSLNQVDRSVDAVRAAGAQGQILFQGDSGYYSHKVAEKIVARDCLFRLAVPRTAPLWRAVARVHDDDWIDARDYDRAQVALIDYVPPGWPGGTRVVARRARYDVEQISADARSRRARTVGTVGTDRLALALGGEVDEVFAYSFFATNEELDLDEEIAQAEWAFRRRTRIKELFRDAAHGAGLNHLPSASHAVNCMWMWGALLANNLSAWLQMLAPLGTARRRIAAIRRLLIHRAARRPALTVRAAACLRNSVTRSALGMILTSTGAGLHGEPHLALSDLSHRRLTCRQFILLFVIRPLRTA
ncbi:hypothetical protein GCM10009753_77570 [Streptantibioticus ferralitis]